MILLTGGTGILGKQLLLDLLLEGEQVRVLYRSELKKQTTLEFITHFSAEKSTELTELIDWFEGDILDIPSLEEAMLGCSRVYHCAALVSFHKRDFSKLIKINREGTANVVNCCLTSNVEKLCYVSSTAAVGEVSNDWITEKTPWKNSPTTSGYSISKYSAEKEVWRGIEEGLNAVMVNPSVILGAGDWNESSLTIFRTIAKGSSFYPLGSNATVDARDVSEIMRRLMNSSISGERYLCVGSNQTFKELIQSTAKVMGKKIPNKAASKWLVSLVRRLLAFASIFTRKRVSTTTETVDSLYSNRKYSTEKIRKELDFEFRSLQETLEFSVKNRMR